jgi:hypothetical protein
VELSLPQLVGGALSLDRATFDVAEHAEYGLRAALSILLLAGISETLGQSVVLILNRVSRLRFGVALGLGGLELIVEAGLWMLSVWLIVGLFGVERPSLISAIKVIGVAYAPLLLGFLVFLPTIGPLLARLLRLWTLLAVVVSTSVVFGLPPWAAAVAAALGFLARVALLRVFERVTALSNRWLWRASAGYPSALRWPEELQAFSHQEQQQ